jgi:hypothetical protein
MSSKSSGDYGPPTSSNPPDIAEAHNYKATPRVRRLLIADTHVQRAKRPDQADLDHVRPRFMRLIVDQRVTGHGEMRLIVDQRVTGRPRFMRLSDEQRVTGHCEMRLIDDQRVTGRPRFMLPER